MKSKPKPTCRFKNYLHVCSYVHLTAVGYTIQRRANNPQTVIKSELAVYGREGEM